MANIRVKIEPSNLDEILKRVEAFERSLVKGRGARSLIRKARKYVIEDYSREFSTEGAFFGRRWRTTKGPVDLKDSGGFEDSFKKPEVKISRRAGVLRVRMAAGDYMSTRKGSNPLRSPLKAFRDGITLSKGGVQLEAKIHGDRGGISAGSQRKLIKDFRRIIRKEAARAGYRVRR